MKKEKNSLLLKNDVREDIFFSQAVKIVFVSILLFFITDFFLGLFLTRGLEKYYGLGTNAKIALVGHSHLMLGVDKSKLQAELKVPIAKYTREGVNVSDRQIMIRQLLRQNSNLKTVIYGVDAWSFTGEGLSQNSHALFYQYIHIHM